MTADPPHVHRWTRAAYDAHLAAVHAQMLEALRTGGVHCPCGRHLRLVDTFRCYHCGLWLCPACSPGHFGPRPAALISEFAIEDR